MHRRIQARWKVLAAIVGGIAAVQGLGEGGMEAQAGTGSDVVEQRPATGASWESWLRHGMPEEAALRTDASPRVGEERAPTFAGVTPELKHEAEQADADARHADANHAVEVGAGRF